MANITINGKDIHLHERVKHTAVMEVQNLMTTWVLENIDIKSLNLTEKDSVENMIKQAMLVNPDIVSTIKGVQDTLSIDQTILLSTRMSLKELAALKTDMYEDDYINLFKASKEALGGTAEDFFVVYDSSTPLNQTEELIQAMDRVTEMVSEMRAGIVV